MNPDNIDIVLVHTTHSGNIGGVARAMKNMGLADLALVVAWGVAYGAFLLAMARYQRARGIERVRLASYRSYPALILWHGVSVVLFVGTLVLLIGPQLGFCVGDVHPLCR